MSLASKLLEYHEFLSKKQSSIAYLVARCHNASCAAKRHSTSNQDLKKGNNNKTIDGFAEEADVTSRSASAALFLIPGFTDERFRLCSDVSEEVAQLNAARSALKAHRRDVRETAASRESVTPVGDHASSKLMLSDQRKLSVVATLIDELLALADSMLRQLEILGIRSFPEGRD